MPSELMLRLLKVAVPVASDTCDTVPFNVAALFDTDRLTVTFVRMLPMPSWTKTVTAGVMVEPAPVLVGGCVKVSVPTATAAP